MNVETAAAAPSDAEPQQPGRARVFDLLAGPGAVVAALFAVLAAGLVLTATARAPHMSPFDEGTHADYALRVSHGEIPAAGRPGPTEITEEAACHGLELPARTPLPPCGQPASPNNGNYNFGHPPLYYAVTGVIARGIDAVVPGRDFITAARQVGMLWLWSAMFVLYLAVRRFGAPWPYAALAGALLPLCPGVLHASSTVTNDAVAPLSGALALWLLAGVLVEGRTGWLLPAGLTLAVTATKVLNSVPFLVLAGVFAVLAAREWRDGDRRAARRLLLAAAAIGAVVLLVYEGWALYQAGRGDPNWVNPIIGVNTRPVRGLPVRELLSTSFSTYNLVSGYFVQAALDSSAMRLWASALSAVLVAAPFMALVVREGERTERALGLATLAGLTSLPLIIELQTYLSSHAYFPGLNPRYAMSFLPWVLACAVLVAWRRSALRFSALAAAAGALTVLTSVTGLL